jgi:hypothetical protein
MTTAVATATGASAAISLPAGEYVLQFTSEGAFELDVQVGDGASFADLYYSDGSTQVTIDSSSGPRHVSVPGGMSYRMDVGTYNSAITMVALRTSIKTVHDY